MEDCTWSGPGKCRFPQCRYSLLAERPRVENWDANDVQELIAAMPSTCALEVASLGPMLLDEIVMYLGMPRYQVEQLELRATRKLSQLRELRRAHWDGY